MIDSVTSGTVGLVSHAAATAAYLLLMVLSLLNWERTRLGTSLILACLFTAVWAAVRALSSIDIMWANYAAIPLETLRSGAWIAFLVILLNRAKAQEERVEPSWLVRWLAPFLLISIALLFVAEVADALTQYGYGDFAIAMAFPTIVSRLLIAIGGLLLIENLFRNTAAESRWSVKYLCLGLGSFFVYDLYLYANGVLFRDLDMWALEARGIINAVVVPLLAVSAARNPDWKVDLFVSRRLAFYSATLIASGCYLVLMALAGYYLREVGGSWGGLLQAAFLFGGVLLLLATLFSGRYRTQLKVFISKHFFNYRYDYRDEWLRFIATISDTVASGGLRERAVQAVADLVESPGGVLLLDRGNGDFSVAAVWNLPSTTAIVERSNGKFMRFLAERQWIIDIPEARQEPDLYSGVVLPQWLEEIRAPWLIVPLIDHGHMVGIVVLQEARARRSLNWEDHDILKTMGRQVASYVAAQEAAKALAEARQFDAFNRRFAFVLHDIKNLVSQLSLMTANAEKHAGNPDFQRDMLLTVQESVAKMKALLERLHGQASSQGEEQANLVALLQDVVTRKCKAGGSVTFNAPAEDITVKGEQERLMTVFEHVIQNALDALTGADTDNVDVRIVENKVGVCVEIQDNGPGMNADFVKNQLFKPFRSTKSAGYGIGAYESRQIVMEAGGSLDVDSTLGQGTTMFISLKREQPHVSADNTVSAENAFALEEK